MFKMNRVSMLSAAAAVAALSVGLLHCSADASDPFQLEDDGHGDAPAGDLSPIEDQDTDQTVVASTTSKTFGASADAEVAQMTASKNLGKATSFGSDSDPQRQSFIRFDVSGLTGTVKSAKFRCYASNGSTNGPAIYKTSGSWSETAITWNNKPSATSSALADLGSVKANSWIEFDVTSALKAGNGTYNFLMGPTSTDSVVCNSREASSNQPQLVVTMDVVQTTPPPSDPPPTTTPPPPTPSTSITCPSGFATEAFRDDFNGTAIDKTKWQVIEQNNGSGGSFTQLTKMLANNVTVSNGRLHIASKRHCQDPYANKSAAENPAKCSGTNYYSGGWIKATSGYAPSKGLMIFLAKMPTPVQGIFPALWARNTESSTYYGEFDLIETWWDMSGKGKVSDSNLYASTTWMGTNAQFHTSSNQVGPMANLVSGLHVWEVEWDATAATPAVKYYYRDQPGATRVLTKTVTADTAGLSGNVSAATFKQILTYGFRPYVDFAVQPDSSWHVGPDTAATYNPEDVEVDSVIVCKP